MLTDPIADMLTRIRNGYLVKKETVAIPYSRIKAKIVEILVKHNYLQSQVVTEEGKDKKITVTLNYLEGKPAVTKLLRISKPGRRLYQNKRRQDKSSLGITIITTSQGIMTVEEASKKKTGGEIICQIW
ncbi:30S ribosomal protein S8 [Candidatus Beckwithbacteria bacterium RBG_13_42_9]|uniref:Small ribosomal subunit protein uS8 n=1 Tax=Candidatus Beckwithbacteria bacterium RBG_13_42_9 TaxID=1797457 RepID=A0A1F5E8Z5_9BACT|nr:MAG: 30S ribosomal protein S8 [Candidatus Beckwithbacteria bacterium RBG_13_42_9]